MSEPTADPPTAAPVRRWLTDLAGARFPRVRRAWTAAAAWLRRRPGWWRHHLRADFRGVPWPAFVLVVLAAVSGGLLGDVLKDAPLPYGLDDLPALSRWAVRIGIGALFPLSVWALVLRRRSLLSVAALSSREPQPHRALVIPISRVPHGTLPGEDGSWEVGKAKLPGASLSRDINALNGTTWPWQQVLRGIEKHQSALRYVYLLGSPDAKGAKGEVVHGSHGQIPACERLLRFYLPADRVEIIVHQEPIDYEDFQKIRSALEDAFNQLVGRTPEPGPGERAYPLVEGDVVIDITGGLKPLSAVGAIMTLNTDATFQYVHTGTGQVIEYDLVHQSAATV